MHGGKPKQARPIYSLAVDMHTYMHATTQNSKTNALTNLAWIRLRSLVLNSIFAAVWAG